MKKLTPFLLGAILLLGAAACDNTAKSSSSAPNSTQESPNAPEAKTVQQDQADATSNVRRSQANSDIRAREQRNNVTGGDTKRADSDIVSEVRSKLEVNIPRGELTVAAKDGAVTVSGMVRTPQELAKIEPLTKEIKGVQTVNVQAVVTPAKPNDDNKSGNNQSGQNQPGQNQSGQNQPGNNQ